MTHKVHPKAFRLQEQGGWTSRWLDRKQTPVLLREDFLIRTFLEKKLKEAGIEDVEIERFRGKLNIILLSARPGLIIGRGGSGAEALRKEIIKMVPKDREVRLEIREVKNPWASASLTAQWVAQQLERRMPHRRLLKQTMGKVMANKEIQGCKIEVAGRLGGADIARREKIKQGRLPLQTLRSIIDYSLHEAFTTYGTIGVKVWMYKGTTLATPKGEKL